MNKKILTLTIAIGAMFCSFAQKPVLSVDFEGNTGKGILKGKAEYVPGVSGKAIRLADAMVTFPAIEKLLPSEGTVTLWIRPVNWEWNKKEFVFFFSTPGIRLYKYHVPLGLLASYGNKGKVGKDNVYANAKWDKFPSKTWMAIAMTWSRKQHLLALYKDGEKIASARLQDSMLLQKLGEWTLNPPPFAPRNRKNATEFDTLRVYNKALSSDEIKDAYLKESPKTIKIPVEKLRATRFNIPEMKNAPKIDGEFDEREWSDAAKLGGFMSGDAADNATASDSLDINYTNDVYAGFHDGKLYFCYIFQLPGATELTAVQTKRDSEVYSDDAAELLLRPNNMKTGDFYQGIFNSRNTIFDQRSGKIAWNGKWQVKSSMYEGYLNIEVAIPISELNAKYEEGMEWGFNFARDRIVKREILFSKVSPFSSARLMFDLGTMKFVKQGLSGRLTFNYPLLFQRKMELKYQVNNRSSQTKKVTFTVELLDPSFKVIEKKEVKAAIPAKGMHVFSYANPLQGIRASILRLTAREEGSKQPFYIQDYPVIFQDQFRINDETDLVKNKVTLTVDCTSHRQTGNASSVIGTLGNRTVKFTGSPIAKGIFDLNGLKPGDYTFDLTFSDKSGKVLLKHKQPYTHIGQPKWLTTHYGSNAGVVWPYTPIQLKNGDYKVWGRSHKFGNRLLPEQITSQGVKLFSAPPELVVNIDGKRILVKNFRFTVKQNKADLAVMAFTASAGAVKFSGEVRMEYDGFMWYDVNVTAPKNTTIRELRLQLPLAKGIAEFYNAHYFGREKQAGKMTLPLHLKRFPSLWAGNLDVGLTFMLESYQSWRNKDVNNIFEFTKSGNSVLWQINMIDRPVKLNKVFHYGFAIEANPAKPNPPWFRSWRLGMMQPHNIMHPWAFDRAATKKYSGANGFYTPVFKSLQVFRDLLAQYKKKGVDFSVYLNPFLCSPESTEWKIFWKDWNNPYNCYPQCPNSSFTDYIMGCMDPLMKEGLKVVYVDSLGAVNCANPRHGCGYIDDETGETVLTWPVRGMREYMKRLYSMLHPYDGRNQREYFIWAHTSARNCVALNAFVDSANGGEELENKIVTEPNYVHLYPLDEYQIFHLSSLAGVPMAGANLGRIGPKKDRYHKPYNDQFLMLVFMHDSQIWNGWLDNAYVSGFYKKLDAWGYKDERIKFHSYRKQKIIVSPDKDIHVSIYQLPDRALAVVGNWQNTPRTVSVRIDRKALGLGNDLTFTDLRCGKPVDPTKIRLPGYNFILMDIRKK